MYKNFTSKKKAVQIIKKNPAKGILEDRIINHNSMNTTSYVKKTYNHKRKFV